MGPHRRPPATAGSSPSWSGEAGLHQARILGGVYRSRGQRLQQQSKSWVLARQQNTVLHILEIPSRLLTQNTVNTRPDVRWALIGATVPPPWRGWGGAPHVRASPPGKSPPLPLNGQPETGGRLLLKAPGRQCCPHCDHRCPGNVFLQGRTQRENFHGSVSLWWLIS